MKMRSRGLAGVPQGAQDLSLLNLLTLSHLEGTQVAVSRKETMTMLYRDAVPKPRVVAGVDYLAVGRGYDGINLLIP